MRPDPTVPIASPASAPREVAEGLVQVRTTSRSGLTVNSFVVLGAEPALVDAGFTTTTEQLVAALDTIGLAPADIRRVVYTHTHEDHMGGGVALAGRWRGDHVVWSGTSNLIGANWYEYYERLDRWDDWLDRLLPLGPLRDGILEARARRHRPQLRTGGDGTLERIVPVAMGDVVRAGHLELECVDARGHDPFHVAWLDRRRRWLFSGDVLLNVPTPIMQPLHDDLGVYRATLLRWAASLDVDVAFPGHGRPITDVGAAIANSLAFVASLWDGVAAALSGDAPVDPAELAFALHGDRDIRAVYVTLANVHSQLVELEALGVVAQDEDRRWRRIAKLPPNPCGS
jgi:glyoxylase-like metal-dependent hydrolase (beta-lactamase superfamily II)